MPTPMRARVAYYPQVTIVEIAEIGVANVNQTLRDLAEQGKRNIAVRVDLDNLAAIITYDQPHTILEPAEPSRDQATDPAPSAGDSQIAEAIGRTLKGGGAMP